MASRDSNSLPLYRGDSLQNASFLFSFSSESKKKKDRLFMQFPMALTRNGRRRSKKLKNSHTAQWFAHLTKE